MKAEKVEILIIGAGAGGGASAWALTKAGHNVVVLDAGPEYVPNKDYQLHQPDWETNLFPDKEVNKHTYTFGKMQSLDKKNDSLRSWQHLHGRFNPGNKRLGWRYRHVKGIGGSTLHFSAEAHRLHPQSMKMFSRFSVAADWPVSYKELEPFYQEAEKLIGVAGPENSGVRWRSEPYYLPAHKTSPASAAIRQACNKLDLNWDKNPVSILSQAYDQRPACNYCNNCARGCPRGDKGSVDVTFIAHARRTGRCDIRANSKVLRLNKAISNKITSVEYLDQSGIKKIINARVILLAAGAIETPRLLLLSKIGNESGLVGKNFMETISWNSSALHPEQLNSYKGIHSDGICWDYNAPDSIPGVIGGARFTLSVASADYLGPASYAKRVVSGWGRSHHKAMAANFGKVLSVGTIGECLPNDKSYIDLDPDKKDQFGLPVARINSFITAMTIKRLKFMATRCRDILKAAGVTQIIEEYGSYDIFNAAHVFGTCRMGNNKKKSVVDKYCQHHQIKNLFIVDASVFPSSGGGESPSLTIEALAIRTAQYVNDELGKTEL